MLSDLAKRWLAYARGVVACEGHHRHCDAPIINAIDSALRWPGFVGPAYETAHKRLLLVGRVHNPSGWHSESGLGLVETLMHEWLADAKSDEQFYAEYNREYARRLPTWGPWKKVYATLAAAAGVDANGVAYTNVAKCWQYPGKESRLQLSCSSEFPLDGLVQAIKPHGVFLLAKDGWLAKVPGAQVRSVPFMNDSAPHFQLPLGRLTAAVEWVQRLKTT